MNDHENISLIQLFWCFQRRFQRFFLTRFLGKIPVKNNEKIGIRRKEFEFEFIKSIMLKEVKTGRKQVINNQETKKVKK